METILLSFILGLSFLIHRAIHNQINKNGNWKVIPKKTKCAFIGCKNEGDQKDHIWPNSLGGPYEEWNFQWLCGFHNRMKSNAPLFCFNPSEKFINDFKNWMIKNGQL